MTSEDKANAPAVVALHGEDPTNLAWVGGTATEDIKAAATIQDYTCDLDLAELNNELSNQARVLNEGGLKRAEEMLMIQAHTLDAIFNTLELRANPGRAHGPILTATCAWG